MLTSLLPSSLTAGTFNAQIITPETLADDLNYQMPDHLRNSEECRYLLDYYRGDQPILYKHDDNRTDDVHTVINFAHAISRNISSYTYSGGVQYVSASPEYFDVVKVLNDFMKRENKPTVSKQVQDYQSICGTAFMSILPDAVNKNDVPFELRFLSPVDTFVVYSVFNQDLPVYGGTCFKVRDKDGEHSICQVYTQDEVYIYKSDGNAILDAGKLEKHEPHILGAVPIVEFPNNAFRLGDFETALSLLDSINSLSSDCLYNINSVVTSYLTLFGVELDEDKLEQVKKNRVMVFPGTPGINQDAKFVYMQLDGTATEFLRNYLESALKFIVGIPDRDSGQTGSDTGAAAELRTGQGDMESVAKTKALYAMAAERQVLDIAMNILSPRYIPEGIPHSEIDVEIPRNNRADMLTKTQAMMNLNQMGFEESDIVFFGNITNDIAGVAKRWKDNKEKQVTDEVQQAKDVPEEKLQGENLAEEEGA